MGIRKIDPNLRSTKKMVREVCRGRLNWRLTLKMQEESAREPWAYAYIAKCARGYGVWYVCVDVD